MFNASWMRCWFVDSRHSTFFMLLHRSRVNRKAAGRCFQTNTKEEKQWFLVLRIQTTSRVPRDESSSLSSLQCSYDHASHCGGRNLLYKIQKFLQMSSISPIRCKLLVTLMISHHRATQCNQKLQQLIIANEPTTIIDNSILKHSHSILTQIKVQRNFWEQSSPLLSSSVVPWDLHCSAWRNWTSYVLSSLELLCLEI